MKKFRLLILLLSFSLFSCAQNLVPNGSFEEYQTCPASIIQIGNYTNWIACRNTPDYFNECAPVSSDASVPSNIFGFQYPASGNAYAGFWAKNGTSEYREHLGIQLSSNLQIGIRYYVSLKVSLATYPVNNQYCGVNKLGVLFSTTTYNTLVNPSPINNYAHVYTNTIITDTLNWVSITGSFVADSAYSFISVGNFYSNSFTDSVQFTGFECNAYYYVDDVCLSTDSQYTYNYTYTGTIINTIVSDISIYPNPVTDFVNVEFAFFTDAYSISVYDELGRQVFFKQNVTNTIEHIPIGNTETKILFLKINSSNETFNCKLIKMKP
ncbi:MAG: T9SS type A sorting domain-containing protein [Chitinophagales bacterium]|nr:T9SS type A sorting domain-containing protein [Chitinophagales bacterium]